MPEAYTHIRTGQKALAAAGLQAPCPAAFALGCQGPDLLFAYLRRQPKLPALGSRMHTQHTGAFLQALVRQAEGDVCQSYVMGFLCHYGADTILHPYVGALTAPGALYGLPGGHGYFEAALDSSLHKTDTGRAAVPAAHSCPPLAPGQLDAIARLLAAAVWEVYGQQHPPAVFAAAYRHTRLVRVLFCSRLGVKKALFYLAERAKLAPPGYLTGHITPARLAGPLPKAWAHPVTGQLFCRDLQQLLQDAVQNCARLLAAYADFSAGKSSWHALCAALGSQSYDTGLPVE